DQQERARQGRRNHSTHAGRTLMSARQPSVSESSSRLPTLPNGSGAAALLAAGVGALVLAVLAIAADRIASFRSAMIFYKPTGPLSGVTTSTIVVWLVVWAILDALWKRRTVALGRIAVAALALLVLGLVLTFPPMADLF
ncbi:MAG: hypothetical protein ACP5FH_11380, partial [Terracidiphilus sp.]